MSSFFCDDSLRPEHHLAATWWKFLWKLRAGLKEVGFHMDFFPYLWDTGRNLTAVRQNCTNILTRWQMRGRHVFTDHEFFQQLEALPLVRDACVVLLQEARFEASRVSKSPDHGIVHGSSLCNWNVILLQGANLLFGFSAHITNLKKDFCGNHSHLFWNSTTKIWQFTEIQKD